MIFFMYLLIAWSLFWSFAFFVQISSGGLDWPADIALLVFFGLVPLAFALWQLHRRKKQREKEKKQLIEEQILTIARQKQWVVAVSDIASSAHIPLEEAEQHLEGLVKRGYADYEVSPNGVITYRLLGTDTPDKWAR
jgi:hypothetical protein